MFYYKIIKNNAVVDVNNTFFRYTKKHKNIVKCDSTYAQLIQSSDEKNFYTAGWLCPLPEGVGVEKVEAVIISEEEYNYLKEQLNIGEVIINEPEPQVESEQASEAAVEIPSQEQVVSIRDLYEEIRQLKAELAALKK